jgi:hypothetical protein
MCSDTRGSATFGGDEAAAPQKDSAVRQQRVFYQGTRSNIESSNE